MSTIFKSLIGTLAAACILACTAGTTLYVWRCMEYAIDDAVAQHVARMRSEEGACHVAIDAAEAASIGCAAFEEMDQPPDGTLVDSKIAAILIDELGEASPAERAVWTELLRHPGAHESYRSLISYYRSRAPHNVERTSQELQAAAIVERPPISAARTPSGNEILQGASSTAEIDAAVEALETARQLLLEKAMDVSKTRSGE